MALTTSKSNGNIEDKISQDRIRHLTPIQAISSRKSRVMGAIGNKKIHPTSDNQDQNSISMKKTSIKQNSIRKNGWSLPLHPLQILSWIFYFLFGGIYFGFMIPMLPAQSLIQLLALITNAVLFILHLIFLLLCISINPADNNVIKRHFSSSERKIRPSEFDRTKHAHVIENQFCYICEVTVGPKAKHCSICNKCIDDFDHHCKWLGR